MQLAHTVKQDNESQVRHPDILSETHINTSLQPGDRIFITNQVLSEHMGDYARINKVRPKGFSVTLEQDDKTTFLQQSEVRKAGDCI